MAAAIVCLLVTALSAISLPSAQKASAQSIPQGYERVQISVPIQTYVVSYDTTDRWDRYIPVLRIPESEFGAGSSVIVRSMTITSTDTRRATWGGDNLFNASANGGSIAQTTRNNTAAVGGFIDLRSVTNGSNVVYSDTPFIQPKIAFRSATASTTIVIDRLAGSRDSDTYAIEYPATITGVPGETITQLELLGEVPEGTRFTWNDTSNAIDPVTGELTFSIPANARPTAEDSRWTWGRTVTATYPDGSTDTFNLRINVVAPEVDPEIPDPEDPAIDPVANRCEIGVTRTTTSSQYASDFYLWFEIPEDLEIDSFVLSSPGFNMTGHISYDLFVSSQNLSRISYQNYYNVNTQSGDFTLANNPQLRNVRAGNVVRLTVRNGSKNLADYTDASLRIAYCSDPPPVPADDDRDPTFLEAGKARCTPDGQNYVGNTVWIASSQHNNVDAVYSERSTTTLYRQNYGQSTFETIAVSPWVYNALAYNPLDGYLYAVSQGREQYQGPGSPMYRDDSNYPAGHLLRISPKYGTVTSLGRINGIQENALGTLPNDLWGGITSGAINANGMFVFSNSSTSGTHDIYTLDLSTAPFILKANRFQNANTQANDFTFSRNTSSNYVYGIKSSLGSYGTDQKVVIERMDIQTGQTVTFDATNLVDPLGRKIKPGIYGTAWTYGNGNLGFGNNALGTSAQIEIVNEGAASFEAKPVAISPGRTSQNNDATSNLLLEYEVDLSVTKKYEGTRNGRAMWTVTVTNESDCLSSGFSLRDDVPAVNYSDVRIDAHSSGWIEGQDLVGNTVFMQHGALTAGESATLTISAERDELATTCVENQASLIGNEEDPVEDNDLAYDRSCEIQIEKTVQDQDGNGVIDGGDTHADGQDRIVYELRVTNPDPVAPHDYVLTDELNFPAWVDIACVQVQELDGQITDREVPVEGEQLPIAQSTIEAKEQHVYLVLVDYRIRPEATEENYESESQCSATDQPGGFLNTAYLESNDTVKDSTACAPIVRPEDVTLFIRKVDAQNTSQTLTDVEFEVFENIDGQPGESIAKLDSPDTANPGFFSAVLRPNIEYLLIETKSPAGYSLLPKPIEFEIRRDVDGNAVVVLGEDYRSTEIVNDLVDFEKTTHTVYIAVADFRQGDLPETGGRGVGGAIGFGIFIVLIGAVCSRRNA